jgi:outer membrane protein assembly factor BamE (lipoprotein component of BamABCDE complex)
MSHFVAAVKAAAAVDLFSAVLIGCQSRVTAANFDCIQSGMTRAEVVLILGEPDETAGVAFGGLSGQAATWSQGDDQIIVQFVNNKVFGKQAMIGSEPRKQHSDDKASAINPAHSKNAYAAARITDTGSMFT